MENQEDQKQESAPKTSKKGRLAILGVLLLGLAKFGEDGFRLLLHAHGLETFIVKGAKEIPKYGIGSSVKRWTTPEEDILLNKVDSAKVDSNGRRSDKLY